MDSVYTGGWGSVGRSGGDRCRGSWIFSPITPGSLIWRETQEPSESTGTLTMESLSVCCLQPSLKMSLIGSFTPAKWMGPVR